MSSGSRSLLGEVVSWMVALGICAFGLLHYDELKAYLLDQALQSGAAQTATADVSEQVKSRSGGSNELRMSSDGHFHADAEINGRSVQVLVDTGATMVALTYEDAERAGIYVKDSDFTQRVSTANGVGRVAPVMVDRISIGDVTVRNVRGAVVERGMLASTLLGMTFLGRLSRAEMRSGILVIEE